MVSFGPNYLKILLLLWKVVIISEVGYYFKKTWDATKHHLGCENLWCSVLTSCAPSHHLVDTKYILVVVDYLSKWVKVVALPLNDSKLVIKFIKKHIFTRFGTTKAIISAGGKNFIYHLVKNLVAKYGVRHNVATDYHSQKSVQMEVSNREFKQNM